MHYHSHLISTTVSSVLLAEHKDLRSAEDAIAAHIVRLMRKDTATLIAFLSDSDLMSHLELSAAASLDSVWRALAGLTIERPGCSLPVALPLLMRCREDGESHVLE